MALAGDIPSLRDAMELMPATQDTQTEGLLSTELSFPVTAHVGSLPRCFDKLEKSPSSPGCTSLSILLMHRLRIECMGLHRVDNAWMVPIRNFKNLLSSLEDLAGLPHRRGQGDPVK